jgi:hypothetical protein
MGTWLGGATIFNLSLSTTQETLFQAVDLGQHQGYVRIRPSLGGTNPQGYFRIWLTGRDQSFRAA